MMLDLAVQFPFFLLALIACHRIWHREDIFAWLVRFVKRGGVWTKPLWCSSCSPIWFGAGLAAAWAFIPVWAVWALAAYPFVRSASFLYTVDWHGMLPGRKEHLQRALDEAVKKYGHGPDRSPSSVPVAVPAPPVLPAPAPAPAPPSSSCDSCAQRAATLTAQIAPMSASDTVRAAATSEVTLAVPVDADDESLRLAVGLMHALARTGTVARLIGVGDMPAALVAPGSPPLTADRLLAAAADLPREDVLFAEGTRSLHIADVLVLAGPRAGDLQWDAAMHGVVMVAAPGRASIDPQALVSVAPGGDLDPVVDRILDVLLPSPAYRARKAILRRGTASRLPVSR
jgi:hypothetical protein